MHGKGLAVSEAPVKDATVSTMEDDPTNPLGNITIVPPFDSNYSLFNLGAVPGVPSAYGGLTLKHGDPNTLLIGGAANSPVGRIYQIGVTRDANGHITGFPARLHCIRAQDQRLGNTTTEASPLDRTTCSS